MKKILLSLIALVAMSVCVMAQDPVFHVYAYSNGQEIEMSTGEEFNNGTCVSAPCSTIDSIRFTVSPAAPWILEAANIYDDWYMKREYFFSYNEDSKYTFTSGSLTCVFDEPFTFDEDDYDGEDRNFLKAYLNFQLFTGGVRVGFAEFFMYIMAPELTPTAIENTAAAVKAVKTIKNGQMIILRDGKKFNALGAKL